MLEIRNSIYEMCLGDKEVRIRYDASVPRTFQVASLLVVPLRRLHGK